MAVLYVKEGLNATLLQLTLEIVLFFLKKQLRQAGTVYPRWCYEIHGLPAKV